MALFFFFFFLLQRAPFYKNHCSDFSLNVPKKLHISSPEVRWKLANQFIPEPRQSFVCPSQRQMCIVCTHTHTHTNPKTCCFVFFCDRDAPEAAHHRGICGCAGVWAQPELWDLHHGLWKLKDASGVMETDLKPLQGWCRAERGADTAAGCTIILTKHLYLVCQWIVFAFYILLVSLKVSLTHQQTLKPPDYV